MPAKGVTPGLQRKPPDKSGVIVMYWAAPRRAIIVGYEPETVRIEGFDDVASREWPLREPLDARARQLAAKCEELWAKMEKWLVEKNSPDKSFFFDGTVGGLIKLYQTHPDSPYQEVEENTQKTYDKQLRQIDRVMGKVRLDQIHAIDLRRWYKTFKKPKNEKDRKHVSGTHHLMGMVRTILKFGAECGFTEAIRLRDEMRDLEFQNAPAREPHLTYEMSVPFIARAHERGDHEMAMAQAFQYDGTLRQTDVIGKWKTKTGEPKWVGGLLWQEISRPELVLDHLCGKTEKRIG
jgi:hypothetical protein